MADGGVGSVFLDLIVRDTVEKQVKNLAGKAQAQAKQSFAGMEQAVSDTVNKAVAKATKAATSAASAASRAADAAQKAVQAAASSASACGKSVEGTFDKSFSRSVAIAQARVTQIEKAVDNTGAKLDTLWNSGNFNPDDRATQTLLAQQERQLAQLEAAQERLSIEVQAAAQKRAAAEEAAAQRAAAADARAKAKQEAVAQKAAAAQQRAAQQAAAAQEREARRNETAQQKAAQAAAQAHEKAADRIRNAISRAFGGGQKQVNAFGRSVGTVGRKLASASSHVRSFGSRLKSIVSGALIFNLLSAGLRKVTDYFRTAISSTTEMQSAMANLSGAASSAAAPLINVLTPALAALANAAATVLAYLTQMISFFTGRTVSAVTGASKKIQGGAGAAKKAIASLAGFDEIQKLDGKDSGGGGGGGAPATENGPEVQLPDWAALMAQQLKKGQWAEAASTLTTKLNSMVQDVDWASIGQKIAEKFHAALTFLATAITTFDWFALGASVGTLLNNVIYGVDWANLGVVLGAKFIVAIEGIGGFISTFDWAALGSTLSACFMGLWNAIDWPGIGTKLTEGVRGLLATLRSATQGMNWNQIGEDIGSALNNIDWVGIFSDLGGLTSDLFAGALDLLLGACKKIDWGQLGTDLWNSLVGVVENIDWSGLIARSVELLTTAVFGCLNLIVEFLAAAIETFKQAWDTAFSTYFEPYLTDAGEMTIEGFFQGILDMMADIGSWIVENIWNPFIEGFKTAFGIHSPSSKMKVQGGNVIEGLYIGIKNGWKSIKSFFKEKFGEISETISQTWSDVKEWTSETWETVSTSIADAWKNVKSWTGETVETVKSKVSGTWENVKSNTSTKWAEISNSVSSAWGDAKTWIAQKGEDIKTAVSGTWQSVKRDTESSGSGIQTSTSGTWANVLSTVTTKLSDMKKKAATSFAEMKKTSTSENSSIESALTRTWGNIKASVASSLSGVQGTMSSVFSSLASSAWTWGRHIIDNLASGIQNYTWKLRNIASHAASIIKSFLGFSEPEKGPLSNFHTYMPDMIDLMVKGIRENEHKAVAATSNMAGSMSKAIQSSQFGSGSMVANAMPISGSVIHQPTLSMMGGYTVADSINSNKSAAQTNEENTFTKAMAGYSSDMVQCFDAVVLELKNVIEAIYGIDISMNCDDIGEAYEKYKRKMAIVRGGS